MKVVYWSLSFLILNMVVLQAIVWLKRRKVPLSEPEPLAPPTVEARLGAENILEWEFEYVRDTASEAMQDRHTMVNFYLVLVGVVASGVLANLDKLEKWEGGATLLLWSVCCVGWCHFLILVRLREAWHESLQTMLQIREFCVRHAEGFSPDVLLEAFRWRKETLPRADKAWSVFHFSALLIGLLDSIAFGVGGYLLSVGWKTVSTESTACLVILCVLFFAYHLYLYTALLEPKNLEYRS